MSRHIARQGLLCLALGLLVLAARAETVKGLYEAEVPVAGQDEQSRAVAVDAGFRQVLLKVAGSSRVLDNPAVAAVLPRADSYLLQFYFTQISYPPRDSGPAAEPGLHVAFTPRAVNDILRRAGAPMLPPNRPATLLWLALDDGSGARLLSRATDTAVADWIGFHAARRAMPLLFPQMDLEDTTAVAPEQVWALDVLAPKQAAARYGVASVLVGKLVRGGDGVWLGEWRQLIGEEDLAGQGRATDIDALSAQLVDFVADAVAARYGVQTGLHESEQLRLRVDGLDRFGSYRQLTALLAAMSSVRSARLVLVDRDTFFFDIVTGSGFESLAKELSLLKQLHSEGAEGELRYRWVGG